MAKPFPAFPRERKNVKVVALMYDDGSYDIWHDVGGKYQTYPNWHSLGEQHWQEYIVTWITPHEEPDGDSSNRPRLEHGVG